MPTSALWLRWFGHAARRPDDELIKNPLLPTPPRTWRMPAEVVGSHDQGRPGTPLQTASLRPGTMDWVKVFSELAQNPRAWSASVRDVVK